MKRYLIVLISVFSFHASQAQFEKKLTFDFSLGYAIPFGEDLREDRLPYFYSNMSDGLGFAADFQYNLSRKISVGLRGEYTEIWGWYDPRKSEVDPNDASYITLVGISPYGKYRILDKKISPFVILAFGATIYNGERSPANTLIEDFFVSDPDSWQIPINEVLIREPGQVVETSIAPNSALGIGVEMDISETIGVFILGNYNVVFTGQNEELRQNMQYFFISGGINLNFVKSKTF